MIDRVWTAERDAWLVANYPNSTGGCTGDMAEALVTLRAMPGLPIASRHAIKNRVRELRLSKSKEALEEARAKQNAIRLAASIACRVAHRDTDKFSPERCALIREQWRMKISRLTVAVNALPGAPVSDQAITRYGHAILGLPQRKTMSAAPAPAPHPVWTAPVIRTPQTVVPMVAPTPAPPATRQPLRGELRADGVVLATFADIRAWYAQWGRNYDGSNVHEVNAQRERMGLPRVLQCEEWRMEQERAA